ncbi:DUF1572 family protein [Mucilaginibacter xinganensis]|uniref:DUF1572 domain-containing protein n=1 Tax=Mucilaginibacter xinganensis TaxID=1234841 RepID=A0A223P1I7_9SPHI|nr:DUF1572 family protein [Mucilaginibacter xinganensis]ASU35985.1 hypothetical protein MuYL_4100 [Mucilaginibacter xinganensis]
MESGGNNYLSSVKKQFHYYHNLADRAIEKLSDEQIHWQYNTESNSIAIIMKHVAGNSISRWTDFLTTDGEKQSRNRDMEFEDNLTSKEKLLALWQKGWQCIYNSIDELTSEDLMHTIYIRGEAHTVIEAINRQLAHLPYHVGQMVYIAKMISAENWTSLTIPKGESNAFNAKISKKQP